jgi:hypothetical protein
LLHIVQEIQHLLYGEVGVEGVEVWNANKDWNSETHEYLAEVRREAGLAPGENGS